MRTVISIDGRTKQLSSEGREYTITYLTVDDGTECQYYGEDVNAGDEVEVFLDKRWDRIKARKRLTK